MTQVEDRMTKPIIALDSDGVLLDYNLAYAHAWARAFGSFPLEKRPQAYWALDRWDVRRLGGPELDRFRLSFDEAFWSGIPALPGALEACLALDSAGYDLVCVTSLPARFQQARANNLRSLGFPIERVFATDNVLSAVSPKAQTVAGLMPVAFVDDYLPYLSGIPRDVHAALVMRDMDGSPNVGEHMLTVHSQHVDLWAFAQWWLARSHKGLGEEVGESEGAGARAGE